MSIIAIDFDNTIRNTVTNKPMEGAKDAISLLREKGHKVMIHSCNTKEFIKSWLNDNDIRYDYIWDQIGKPVCSFYIDDRNIKFTDWPQTLSSILGSV